MPEKHLINPDKRACRIGPEDWGKWHDKRLTL